MALQTKIEKAERDRERARERFVVAEAAEVEANRIDQKSGGPDIPSCLAMSAARERQAAERGLEQAERNLEKLEATPRLILQRDTTRENIATALSVSVLFLIEYVLREFLGGVRMELSTFIDHFVNAPVTVRSSRHQVLYQIHANDRNPTRTRQWHAIAAEVTRRGLKQGNKVIILEVVERRTATAGGRRKPVTAHQKSRR